LKLSSRKKTEYRVVVFLSFLQKIEVLAWVSFRPFRLKKYYLESGSSGELSYELIRAVCSAYIGSREVVFTHN